MKWLAHSLAIVVTISLTVTIALTTGMAVAQQPFTEYTIPNANRSPVGITTGPDGNLWFTEYSANKIGKVTTTGTSDGPGESPGSAVPAAARCQSSLVSKRLPE